MSERLGHCRELLDNDLRVHMGRCSFEHPEAGERVVMEVWASRNCLWDGVVRPGMDHNGGVGPTCQCKEDSHKIQR